MLEGMGLGFKVSEIVCASWLVTPLGSKMKAF